MTDLTITAANVSELPGAITRDIVAGGSGSLGDLVYIASDGDAEQADASAVGTAKARGLVTAIQNGKTSFVAGDMLTITIWGPVTGFSSMTPGADGYVSDTAGKLANVPGTVLDKVGYAWSATIFMLNCEQKAETKVTLVAGGSAGDHTVTGIATTDKINFVGHLSTAAAIATLADITSEFSITAADTINNAAGTDTSSDQLMVIWTDLS